MKKGILGVRLSFVEEDECERNMNTLALDLKGSGLIKTHMLASITLLKTILKKAAYDFF